MLRRLLARDSERDNDTVGISIKDWQKMFRPGASVAFNGRRYQSFQTNAGPSPYYDNNAVVFACEANRLLLFSEARFQFQQIRAGRPGELFGTDDLSILEEPWAGASTRDLLVQADLDILAYGNSYWVRDGAYLVRLDPCRTKVITEAAYDVLTGRVIGERLAAYAYLHAPGEAPSFFLPSDVAHYKPYPDAKNRFIGTSWLSACLPDVDADDALTEHKRTAVRDGANLGYVVSLDKDIGPDQFSFFVDKFRSDHERPENAGKTLFLGGGADVKTVGQTFENLAFKAVQGAGETRVAACSGVPPVIVGLSEGLSAATYSNYGQARRRLVDGTMRPLWGFFASAMQSLMPPMPGARLWYDDRDIPFLREDVKEQALILGENARTVVALINGGYSPDDVVNAVSAGDIGQLKGAHTGLVSVQLQPPGLTAPDSLDAGSTPTPTLNGNGVMPKQIAAPTAK